MESWGGGAGRRGGERERELGRTVREGQGEREETDASVERREVESPVESTDQLTIACLMRDAAEPGTVLLRPKTVASEVASLADGRDSWSGAHRCWQRPSLVELPLRAPSSPRRTARCRPPSRAMEDSAHRLVLTGKFSDSEGEDEYDAQPKRKDGRGGGRRRSNRVKIDEMVVLLSIVALCFFASVLMMMHHLHYHVVTKHSVALGAELVAAARTGTSNSASTITTSAHAGAQLAPRRVPALATLTCPAGDGAINGQTAKPSSQDLVYWRVSPSDDAWRSPWASRTTDEPRYVTFETDLGGWNNVRMALETIFVFARATVSGEWGGQGPGASGQGPGARGSGYCGPRRRPTSLDYPPTRIPRAVRWCCRRRRTSTFQRATVRARQACSSATRTLTSSPFMVSGVANSRLVSRRPTRVTSSRHFTRRFPFVDLPYFVTSPYLTFAPSAAPSVPPPPSAARHCKTARDRPHDHGRVL